MLGQLGFDHEGYVQSWTHPQNGQKYPEYRLPKDLTVTLITGYRADLRYKGVKRLVDRWQKLEARQVAPRPDCSITVMAASLRAAD